MATDNIYPEDATIESFFTGSLFADKTPIYQLGIQALPGTKFFLNVNKADTGFAQFDNIKSKTFVTLNDTRENYQTDCCYRQIFQRNAVW